MADLEKMKIRVVVIVAQAIVGLAMIYLAAITVIVAIQEQAKAGAHHVIMTAVIQIIVDKVEAETIGIVDVAHYAMETLIQLLAELVLVKDNLEIA